MLDIDEVVDEFFKYGFHVDSGKSIVDSSLTFSEILIVHDFHCMIQNHRKKNEPPFKLTVTINKRLHESFKC